MATLVLLCLPGTSIAGGASDTSSTPDATSLLRYGAGYGEAEGGPPVREVQRSLRGLGWQPGPLDGLYGPRTEAAVTRFQTAARVAADGIVGPQTRRALTRADKEPLRRGAGFAQPDGSPRVRALQVRLQRHGLRPGPVDGLFGPRTQKAVERLQRTRGIPVNGVANDRTRRVFAAAPKQPEESSPNEAPAEAPPTTEDNAPAQPTPITRSDSGDVPVPLVVLIGLAALLLGLLGGALLGRRNRVVSGTAVPLAQGVTAEGTSNARSVGRFRGTVHALVLGRRGLRRTPEARYLVSDPGKQDPFWVSQDEVSNIVPPLRTSPFQRSGERMLALGYVSVPANEELQRVEFDAQLEAIDSYCDERGWELVEVVRDVDTGARDPGRQGLLYALDKIGRGEAEPLGGGSRWRARPARAQRRPARGAGPRPGHRVARGPRGGPGAGVGQLVGARAHPQGAGGRRGRIGGDG
jgi:peptidoglycan hydrolase-like protein with peptidoglycan-binding domain